MLFEVDERGVAAVIADDSVLPDGAYTTLRTYGGRRVLRLEQHVARLAESVARQGASAALPGERVRAGLASALDQAGLAEARARITFAPPRLALQVAPFEPLAPALYAQGVACATLALRRRDPRAKDTRFLALAESARGALPAGVHEGLMVAAEDGALLEGLSSNFFALAAGELRTEARRVLPGVTRAIVLELAAGFVPVRPEAVRREDLPALAEAFLTSVSRGVLPVVSVDGATIGDGRPGAVTRELMRRFEELGEREARPL